jgi:predicted ATPase/class 3 adenylate cyclase
VPQLPTGIVTFLFTDIEGSTRLIQELGHDPYRRVQDRHDSIMRTAIAEGEGIEIRTEGDSFFAVFSSPDGAVRAAVAAQRGLAETPWPDGAAIRVRMGLHSGEGILGGDNYLGIEVNRAARIAATGHGGQIVLSDTTSALVASSMPAGTTVRDLGPHRLKDFERSERLHDLVIDGLPAEFPPLRSLEARRTNLPPHRTSFVGRTREIPEIASLLGSSRLLTITGPGGTGKTRLAQEVGTDQLERFSDGAFFVDLSTVSDAALVVPEIAAVLGVRETPGRPAAVGVQEHLRDLQLLLVLDNFEQLLEAGPAVGALLDAAPRLTILCTSRTPLHLSGEQEYRLEPLALPAGRDIDPQSLATSESVRLFVERVAAVRPGFRVTDENAPAVSEIVTRLDGLPLALELAASRLRVLSPDALASRLGDRLPLLTGGARDVPERQRTLRETIRWSEEALGAEERRLFDRLSVFAGGWTLEAAEAVCGDGLDALEVLDSLIDTSLVRRQDLADGTIRFSMLETIREYAAERFERDEAGDRDEVRRRHARFVRDLVEEAEPHLTDEHQTRWIEVLEREHDNVRAALDRAQRAENDEDVEEGLRTAAAIWRFWQTRGHMAEGRGRLEGLLALPAAQRRDAARAQALGALGSIDYWLTAYEPMRTCYVEAVDIARELGDRRLLSRALFNLSSVPEVMDGDLAAGGAILEESLETAEEEDVSLRARIWTGLGIQQLFTGNPAGAVEPLEHGIALLRETGTERLALCEGLISLAGVRFVLEDFEGARARLAEAIDVAVATGPTNPQVLGTVVLPSALLANHEGNHRRAAMLTGAWTSVETEFDVHFPEIGRAFFGDPAEEARAALGDNEFERAQAEGAAMHLDAIVALVTEG